MPTCRPQCRAGTSASIKRQRLSGVGLSSWGIHQPGGPPGLTVLPLPRGSVHGPARSLVPAPRVATRLCGKDSVRTGGAYTQSLVDIRRLEADATYTGRAMTHRD